jgi:hypothetical protein
MSGNQGRAEAERVPMVMEDEALPWIASGIASA